MNLQDLVTQFPRNKKNASHVGRIPMSFFNDNEVAIRAVMRQHKLKAMYRGSRVSNNMTGINKASMTRRCDAKAVLLYNK